MMNAFEEDRIITEGLLNAQAEGQVDGQVKEQGESREEQGEERIARSPKLSEHFDKSSSPSPARSPALSRSSGKRHNSSRDKISDSSGKDSYGSSRDDFDTSEGGSDESELDSLGGLSLAASAVDSDEEIEDIDGLKAAADLTNFLNSRFRIHRQTLRSEICNLRDDAMNRLYSDPEIERQFTAEAATTPAETTTGEAARDTGGKPIDTTFGHHAIVGSFSIPRQRKAELGFQHEQVPMANVAKHLAEFSKSHEKSMFWVHLPVNNLLWVQVCTTCTLRGCKRLLKHFVGKNVMLELLNVKYKDMALSKKTLNRVLRRERNAVRRASGSKRPAMLQPLPSACRKIQISERTGYFSIVTFMVCFCLSSVLLQKIPFNNHGPFQMPYLHWERSLSRMHTARIIQDAQEVAKDISQRNRKTVSVQEVSGLPCTGFEKMIRYHSVGRPGLLIRQTLDQHYYQSLDSTESRDRDQVVERYSRKCNWQGHEHRILMVDQLWIWILDDGRD